MLVPLVPGRGFEPRSPVLQTGAVTRSAFRATQELVRTPVIETGPSEWRSETRPSSYIRMVGSGENRTSGPQRDGVYSAATAPAVLKGTSRVSFALSRANWRKVKESNHRRFRRPGFRDRLLATERHLPCLGMIVFRKPLHTPDQVRGRLFRDHAVWASRGGSNTRPHGPEPCALPSELRDELAARRGFDPLSSVRQTDCHASSITGPGSCLGARLRPAGFDGQPSFRTGLPAEAAEQRRLVVPHGNDPRSPGYRPGALPLSYGTVTGRR